MSQTTHLSVQDKLLLAAYALDRSKGISFTAEDLVVAAWSMFPMAFGLKGYLNDKGFPMYPDSNRVFAEIMGSKPLRRKGYLAKIGPKLYALTESGRLRAEGLEAARAKAKDRISGQASRSSLPRDHDRLLRQMLSSRALTKVKAGEIDTLTFFDACVFWGITPQSSGMKMYERLANAKRVIAQAQEIVGRGAMRIGSKTLTGEDLQMLDEVDETLRERFSSDLKRISNRTDERQRRY